MKISALVAALLITFTQSAASAAEADAEILYLLEFVEKSGCDFERNGTVHDSADAAGHLRLKYRRGGKYASNADQFIDRLASESSWTGKKYTVTCDGTQQMSGEWLHQALDDFRQQETAQ